MFAKRLKYPLLLCSMMSFFNPAYSDATTQLTAIADRYEQEYFSFFPEIALFMGRNDAALDHFRQHTLTATKQWQRKEDAFLDALNQLDEKALEGTPQYITYRLLKETLENNVASRICHEDLWNVSPIQGWHVESTQIAERQPVGTSQNRAMALARWKHFPTVVDEEINNLKAGINQGYTAPKVAVEGVIKQLAIILKGSIEESPYFDMAKRDTDETFTNDMTNLIQSVINPALQHYQDYLQYEYLPKARSEVGVFALPNGDSCYLAKIKEYTTLSISPKDIHAFGLSHMEKLKSEVAEIGLKEFGVTQMSEVYKLASTEPRFLFKSEQDILDYNQQALSRAESSVHDWFNTLPITKGILKPYPEYRAKTGASGEYNPPSEDGSQPGIYYINTYDPQHMSKVGHEATVFHELIPGHHFQIALQYENKSHHSLDKYLWNSGFGEGWALYVERLADEMHLYSENISKLGMLSNESLRAARLVIDPGMHALHWTREQAIDYLVQHTAGSRTILESEVDRYIMLPGQATAYMIGKREIETLRAIAQERLKERFDIREFHDRILENGAISLPFLHEQIVKWLEHMQMNTENGIKKMPLNKHD